MSFAYFIRLPVTCLAAAALSVPAADLPTTTPGDVRIEAQHIKGSSTRGQAHGDVKACFRDFTLNTETLEYDHATDLLQVPSAFKLQSPDYLLHGDSLRYQPQAQRGTAQAVNLEAGSLQMTSSVLFIEPDYYRAEKAEITSCPVTARDWWLEANELRLDADNMEGRHMLLRASGIPLIYLPRFSLPIGDAKRSGFLWPDADYSNNEGFSMNVPYYWFLAENYDATTELGWSGKHGFLLKNNFRYLTPQHSGNMQVDWSLFTSENRGRQYVNHVWTSSNWRLELTADNVSDSRYFRDFSDDTNLLAIRNLPRRARWEYVGDNWRFGAAAESLKTLDTQLIPPHDILPQLWAHYDGRLDAYAWRSDWEYSKFKRNNDTQQEADRWLWRTGAWKQFEVGNWHIRPEIGFHAALYDSDGDNTEDAQFIVPYGLIRADSGYRPTPWQQEGASYQWQLAYAYAPENAQQHRAPLFDTALRRFSAGGIYDWNRFSGDDRAADAHWLAYGINFRWWDFDTTRELASLEFAQRYYLRRPRIILPDESTPPSSGFANIIVALRIRAAERWRLEADTEWNTANSTFESSYADTRADFGNRRLLRVGMLIEEEESVLAGGSMPLGKRMDIAFLSRYLMDADTFAESAFAVELRDDCDCWKLFFKVTNHGASSGDNKVSYSIGVEFSGLGKIGNSGYDNIVDDLR